MQQHLNRRVIVRTLKLKKLPVVIPTVPEGIDEKSFKQASFEEKVKMIPTKLLEEIKLEEQAQIFSDDHELYRDEGDF